MTNLSQQKREKMLEYLHKLKELNTTDDESLSIIGEIETALNEKRYGLVWEEHSEHVDEMLVDNIPVFVDVPEKTIVADEGEKYNFLLEGDNLHSLKLLQKTHEGKIDFIYIDPPYNTGNTDFVYNDTYVGKTDGYSHSKWLSFMHKRLEIAHNLLTDQGVIFISIDNNEQAQLKLLCDDIFGQNGFIGTIIQNSLNSKNDSANLQRNHEYIHVYRKVSKDLKQILTKQQIVTKEVIKEGDRFYYIIGPITTRGAGGTLNSRPNLGYTVYYNPVTNDIQAKVDYDVELARTSDNYDELYCHDSNLLNKGYYAIVPPKVRGKLGSWTWSLERFNQEKDNIVITGKAPKFAVNKRTFVESDLVEQKDNKYVYTFVQETSSKSIIEFSTNDGSKVLKKVLGEEGAFNNPKNLEMIKYFLSLYNQSKDFTVLDFFAGSGTTGHAVQLLNKEDGGNRTYILCTNNENDICERVTYKRLSNIQEDLPHNLRYFKTDFVPKYSEERSLTSQTVQHVRELIELEHQVLIDGLRNTLILKSSTLREQLEKALPGANVYVGTWIYMDSEEYSLIDEKRLNLIYVPDYYFEAELTEVGEL